MPLSRASLEKLLEASPDIVVATDAKGNVDYYNDGAQENLGYSREEIIGEYVVRLYPNVAEAKRVMAAMRENNGRVESFPTRFVRKDGQQIPVAISGVILYGDDRSRQGTIGFAKNLTEILRKDKLAVLGEIAVGLSHQINNPLEVITNELELIERSISRHPDSDDRERDQTRIRAAREEVDRIASMLRRLAEMAESQQYESAEYVQDARMIDLSEREASPLRGAHVLVVDDDEGVRRTVAEILKVDGCRVELASNGVEALRKLDAAHFDLVLSDVVMPDMDGYDLFQAARQRFPDTPVALMTAYYYDREHVIKRSRVEGLSGVLFKKPIDPERLRETLGGLIKPPPPTPS